MIVRWKQHEITFATIAAATLKIGYLVDLNKTGSWQYADPFIKNGLTFNWYRNLVIPQLGSGLLLYAAYLFLNLFTIPQFLKAIKPITPTAPAVLASPRPVQNTSKTIATFARLILQLLAIIAILGTAFNVSIYYLHQWQFNYPGFSIFFNKSNHNSQMDIFWGYGIAAFLLLLFAIYVIIRELVIRYIEASGPLRPYRTLICNQITTFLANYLLVFVFLFAFHLTKEHDNGIVNLIFIIPVFLVFMTNTYWIFPMVGEKSFFRRATIFRLLLSTFFLTFPFIFPYFPGFLMPAFTVYWAVQLLIVTPITWHFYRLRKDKIIELKGAQKALSQSNADLQFLRSQINPHFLFNILNTIYGTALQENAERTAEAIQKLGDMMRFMLQENNQDFIQMSREIDYLKNYVSLQELRTQSSPDIRIQNNINESSCNHQIAPMLLIPLVENAFKHGISLKEKSWIEINLDCDEKDIHFEVRNSIHARRQNDPEKKSPGIGLSNVSDRLKLIYPGRHKMTINQIDNEFIVQLTVQPAK